MAMRQCCDVFETSNDIKEYVVLIVEIDQDKKDVPVNFAQWENIVKHAGTLWGTWHKHLCARGIDRLTAKIETGTTPPKKRKPRDVKDAP